MDKPLRVVMVGPAQTVNGGISRVANQVCQALPQSVRVTYVSAFSQYTGYGTTDKGSRLVQFFVFLVAFARTAWHSLVHRRTVFHLHLSQRGSFVRKGVLALWLRAVGARFIVQNHAASDGEMFLQRVPGFVNRLMVWALRGADACLVVTAYWRRYYAEQLGFPDARIVVLPNPTRTPLAIPVRDGREPVQVVFLGRIGKRKGAFDLIHAFASLPAPVGGRCRLLMAGDGEVDAGRALAQSLGCADRVTLTGWVGPDEVSKVLAESDIFILPSYGEGMSAALLEAMGWGLAVITTAEGGADEFLQHGTSALLVRAGDVAGISAAVELLVTDQSLRLSLGRHARRAAMPFDLPHHIERLTDIYRNVSRRRSEQTSAKQGEPDSSEIAGPAREPTPV